MSAALQAACSNTWIDTTVHAVPGISLSAGHGHLSTRLCTHHHTQFMPTTWLHPKPQHGADNFSIWTWYQNLSPIPVIAAQRRVSTLGALKTQCHEPTTSWNSVFCMRLLWFSGCVRHRTLWDAQDLINTPGIPRFTEWTLSELSLFHYCSLIVLTALQMTHSGIQVHVLYVGSVLNKPCCWSETGESEGQLTQHSGELWFPRRLPRKILKRDMMYLQL